MSEDTSPAEPIVDYDIQKILKALPHRYPLLLVDRVKRIDLGERIHAVKAVTMNEEFFQGHFPGAPIMPGVLQIEALAQAAAILGIETLELAGSGKLVYFMGIDGAKFRAPVTPGCLLTRMSGSGGTCFGLYADAETAASAAGRMASVIVINPR